MTAEFQFISNFISGIFSPLGLLGGLICIFLLFFIDAIIFPTVPELITIVIYTNFSIQPGANPLLIGVAILIVIVIAEVAGLTVLYLVVKKVRVPNRIHIAIKKYQSFLIYPDERMILVNRVAPILPFLGAFVALCDWNYLRSVKYTVIGGVIKYGAILLIGGVFIELLDPDTAFLTTMIMVILVIVVGFIISFIRKKRMEGRNEDSPA